jgi:hypothetical protein
MLAFVGPSYQLDTGTRKAGIQRAIGLYLSKAEPGNQKAEWFLKDQPGLTLFKAIGVEIRGMFTTADGKCYVAAGSAVYRMLSDATTTNLGTLLTSTGPVEFAANSDQVGFVDGSYGYVITLATDTFARITSANFYGSKTITVIDGYGLFIRPDTQEFYISDPDDFTALDALAFAAAEGAPDLATAILADHRQARVFGTHTTEGWFDSGDPDFPFSRDPSSYAQIGCNSPYTARLVSNSVCFLGQSEEGVGVVYMATGNTIDRISTPAVEQALQVSTDLTLARAFVYLDEGHLFYVLNAPGLATTWVFDVSTRSWHERAEQAASGGYEPWRPVCHTVAFGYHLVGDADGNIYRLNRSVYTNNGDPLPRRRISPHNAAPNLERQFFGPFELDASAGDAPSGEVPVVQMRYSNDGGKTWKVWRERELGRIGEHAKRVRWIGNGSAYDRVWDVQFSGAAPFSIIGARCPVGGGDG